MRRLDGNGGVRAHVEFTTTHWSMVLTARDRESDSASAALDALCRVYWYPLYAYVRRHGYTPQDAQDFTQAFFEHLLRQDFLRNVAPEKGRFRSFLLTCLKSFLADEWRKRRAEKRGSGRPVLVLDENAAERCYQRETDAHVDAEALYERRWALALLERTLGRLEAEFNLAGKQAVFNHLQSRLLGERSGRSYEQLAADVGSTVGAVKMMVLRMRERYRALFREEIAQTVATPADLEEEMRHVLSVLRQ